MAVGKALLTIRDSKLYREQFQTFNYYCKARWGMVKPLPLLDALFVRSTVGEFRHDTLLVQPIHAVIYLDSTPQGRA